MRAADTVRSKRLWERQAYTHGVKIRSYHSDNGIFQSNEFKDALTSQHQTISDQPIRFSGVGAHHQNGIVERAIRTITELSRAMLIHSALHWPAETNEDLWPFSFSHAVNIWNHLPNKTTGLSPVEIFSGTRVDNSTFF